MARKFITLLLFIALITPAFYLPQQAKRTEAIFGFGDLVIDVKALAERIVDAGAMVLAQTMIDRIVASTVKWAQSGFDGNPAYVTNPGEYFGNIADGVAGEFIKGSDLGYLCSPFQASIKLSLTAQYYEPRPFQCTLTGIIGNIENFYSDFSQGGWDAWFTMTQEPTNNPYGAYLKAKIELDSRIAESLNLKKNEYDINKGFLSFTKCAIGTTTNYDINGNPDGEGCLFGKEKTVTPGSVISEQLNQALPAGLNRLINAEHIDQLASAFAAGLLQRYVFGPKGLFNNDSYDGEEGKNIGAPSGNNGRPNSSPGDATFACILSCQEQYCSAPTATNVAISNSPDSLETNVEVSPGSGPSCTADFNGCLASCSSNASIPDDTGTPPGENTPAPDGTNGPGNESGLVNSIWATSAEAASCRSGSSVGCHRFTREVARALAAKDSAWGLITKSPGEQQCSMTACGGNVSGGYGEDVVAYLPAGKPVSEWLGYDIVGGAGGPNPTPNWNGPLPRRSGNNWAPVP